MVHLTFDGQKIVAQPDATRPTLEHAVELSHYCHEPEFFYHYHPVYEFTLTLGTNGERLVGNSINPYQERDLVLLGPNLPHTWVSQKNSNGHTPENYVLHFSLESLGVELLSKSELRHVRKMLDCSHQGICFNPKHIEIVEEKIKELPELSDTQQFLSLMGILDTLASYDGHKLLVDEDYEIRWSENDSILFQRILDYIWANHTEPFNRDAIASHVGLSVSTFSRFFKRMTGKTLVSYVNELKIRRASELLLSSNDSIFDISFAIGFHNCSYFNKQFKAIMGMTPSEYRDIKGVD